MVDQPGLSFEIAIHPEEAVPVITPACCVKTIHSSSGRKSYKLLVSLLASSRHMSKV